MRIKSTLITKSELKEMGVCSYAQLRKAPQNKQFKAEFHFDRFGKVSKIVF